MVRTAKQAAPQERLDRFAEHIRQHDVEAERYGFQVQEASEFFKLYPKRKSPVKNQPEGVGFFRNERKEIFVLYKPRLHRVRRPTEVLNKMGQGWRQFKFTRKEILDKDFQMFYKYSQGLIPGRAEAQTFSSLLLVYYRNLNSKGEYEAEGEDVDEATSEAESEEGSNAPQIVPYSPAASISSPRSSSPSLAATATSPSPNHSPYSVASPVSMSSVSPVPVHTTTSSLLTVPTRLTLNQHLRNQYQYSTIQQQQHQQQQPHTQQPTPFSSQFYNMPSSTASHGLNAKGVSNSNDFLPLPLPTPAATPITENSSSSRGADYFGSVPTFTFGIADDAHNQYHEKEQQQQQEEDRSMLSSSASTTFVPGTGSFPASPEMIPFDFDDEFSSHREGVNGLMIREIDDFSFVSWMD